MQDIDIDAVERFMQELEEYLHEYTALLLVLAYKQPTVSKHVSVIRSWCEYVTGYADLTDFSELTVSLVNSKFHAYYRHNGFDELPNKTLSNIIKRFLFFVRDQYGISNAKVLEKLGGSYKRRR